MSTLLFPLVCTGVASAVARAPHQVLHGVLHIVNPAGANLQPISSRLSSRLGPQLAQLVRCQNTAALVFPVLLNGLLFQQDISEQINDRREGCHPSILPLLQLCVGRRMRRALYATGNVDFKQRRQLMRGWTASGKHTSVRRTNMWVSLVPGTNTKSDTPRRGIAGNGASCISTPSPSEPVSHLPQGSCEPACSGTAITSVANVVVSGL